MEKLHKLLREKMKRIYGDTSDIPDTVMALLQDIDRDYRRFEQSGQDGGAKGSKSDESSHLKRDYESMVQALEESESRYRLLAENSADVIWTMDMDLNYTYISPSAEQVTGFTPEEELALGVDKILTPESMEKAAAYYAEELQKLENGVDKDPFRVRTLDLQQYRKDGSIIDIEVALRFIRDESGRPRGILGVTRDVTARKRTDEALRQSEEKYRTILENIEDGYYEVDLKGAFTFCNEALCRILDYTEEELLDVNYRLYMDRENADKVFAVFNQVFKTGTPMKAFDWKLKRRDGSGCFVETSISPITDKAGTITGFRGIVRDVTERRKIEETLLKRNQLIEKELQAAQLIQKSLLSIHIPEVPEVIIDYRFHPLEAIGGDYFSFTPILEGGLGAFIGDVANHGVSAALYLSLVKAMSDKICRVFALQPKHYLSALNDELLDNMPMSFLTALYGIFRRDKESSRMKFTYSSAGHPYPIWHRPSTGEILELNTRGALIGMLKTIGNEERCMYMDPGDRVFFYTDGIPETINEKSEILGFDGLPELIRARTKPALGETLDAIIQGIENFRGIAPHLDDIVIIGFEVK